MKTISALAAAITLAMSAGAAHGFALERFTPVGQAGRVDNILLRFNEPMRAIGAQDPAPATVRCTNSDGAPPSVFKTRGRWIDEAEYNFEFDSTLPAASQCEITLRSDLRGAAGSVNTGRIGFSFAVAGPYPSRVWPNEYSSIDSAQHFVVQTNAPVKAQSVESFVYCASNKVGERIGVQLVVGPEREAILKAALNPEGAKSFKFPRAELLTVLRCKQELGDGAEVRLVWPKGVQSASGFVNSVQYSPTYRTHPAFTLSVSCEREAANRPCLPVRPITLKFSTPISSEMAKQIRLGDQASSTKEGDYYEGGISQLEFQPPFKVDASYEIKLPKDLKDIHGRSLAAQTEAPRKVSTGRAPPLVKFAARFGIVERSVGVLPVTVRASADAKAAALSLPASQLRTTDDAKVIALMRLAAVETQSEYALRNQPLFSGAAPARALPRPKGAETEVVGIELKEPGLHAIEVESPSLAAGLLTAQETAKSARFFIRSYALHTGLAVHFKHSRENAAVWVTSLETGKPVAGSDVKVSDCNGRLLWSGKTEASGSVIIRQALTRVDCSLDTKATSAALGVSVNAEFEATGGSIPSWLFVSARTQDDYSFALSSWNEGIEPWRFSVATQAADQGPPSLLGHTVFARNLLRQGETVHMKHLLRTPSSKGLSAADTKTFDRIRISHLGSDQSYTIGVAWTGAGSGTSQWEVPKEAKLGIYVVDLLRVEGSAKRNADGEAVEGQIRMGSFQVAQFRLPTVQGRISTAVPLFGAAELPLAVQMNYLNGGAAAGVSASLSALLRPHSNEFADFPDVSFGLQLYGLSEAERQALGVRTRGDEAAELLADKLALKLDEKGAALKTLKLPKLVMPMSLRAEVNYRDPNGEIQTISDSFILQPAKLLVGFKQRDWFSDGSALEQRLVVVDVNGKPQAGVAVEVQGAQEQSNTVRKRAVGGFFTYESREEKSASSTVCSGKTDERGIFICSLSTSERKGNLKLLASVKDDAGNTSYTNASVWLSGADYFKPDNSDRMDLIAAKRRVAPGEVAKFQVRLPFAQATAWVAVEREGVIETFTVELSRDKPVIEVPIKAEYAPNVFVSVLAVRPRLEPLSWWSFFRWGWRSPKQWWAERRASKVPPTAMLDLAKPAYRLGVAEILVDNPNRLKVEVSATPQKVQAREQSTATVTVRTADGKLPPAGTSVALAVVDEALLELKANSSWDLIEALWTQRPYGVETSTAQMQVIGKRHFGLKAVASGGGGGRSNTREILETLAYWNANLSLDAQGKVSVPFKLNDSLTKFRVVAIVDSEQQFGTGSAFVMVSKDLQIISGLPPLVRDEDRYTASVTLRNTTDKPMKIAFTAKRDTQVVLEKVVDLTANSAQELSFDVAAAPSVSAHKWSLEARDTASGKAQDALAIEQRVLPAVPSQIIGVSSLQRVDPQQALVLPIQIPADSLPGKTSVRAALKGSLAVSLEPVREWFEAYPFACLEQRTSKAIGTRSPGLWKIINDSLPNYLDADGLAAYFPGGDAKAGSDVLTAYVLSLSHEAGWTIREDARNRMLDGLAAFAEGKLSRSLFTPSNADTARILSATAALARYNRASPQQMASLDPAVQTLDTSALLDWIEILQRVKSPKRDAQLQAANNELRGRLRLGASKIEFTNERREQSWWMMSNGDVAAARLVLLGMDGKLGTMEWLQDLPRLMNGLVGRQQRGVWYTTTANLWGSLAVEKYAQRFEREPVSGQTTLALGSATQASAWKGGEASAITLPLAPTDRPKEASITHAGPGRPYAQLQVLAAVPISKQVDAGYRITRKLVPVSQRTSGVWSRGDVYRVELEIDASAAMSWVAVSDAVPAGSTVLGGGLRESEAELAKSEAAGKAGQAREDGRWDYAWTAYEERSFEGLRTYYEYLPKGKTKLSYTVRLNQPGQFKLPPTRAEAMYEPDLFGVLPQAPWSVKP